jgi:small subunit ribosomal protein S17
VEAPAVGEPVADDAEKEAPAAKADSGEGEEELTPKQRRRLERSRASGPAGPQLGPAERAERRAEKRRAAAAARRRRRARERERPGGERREGTPPAERTPAAGKVRVGTVVSDRADKTITVRIESARRHPAYEKIVRRSNTLHAHDETNDARAGDVVRIVETRPLSRTKRWRLLEVVERAR